MSLHSSSVSPALLNILHELMENDLFKPFRLVGGTNLSLRYGYRISTDIDLFTDYPYDSIDFNTIQNFLSHHFPYYECTDKTDIVGMGRTYYIGYDKENIIKLDLMYENEEFLHPEEITDGIRMASLNEMAVMKLDAISKGGRKKDFWDLHYLLIDLNLNLNEIIELHSKRFIYNHEYESVIEELLNFSRADDEPDPICLLGKKWDLIKLDIIDIVGRLSNSFENN